MTDQVVTTLQLEKLSLYGEATNGKWSPKLTWAIRKGFPRIIVYTNSGDPGVPVRDTIINAPMNHINFNIFIDIFKKAIKAKPGEKFKMDCLNAKWEDGKTTNEKYLQGSIIIGKDKEGIIWISVVEENKPKIKFEILGSDWHRYYNTDGSQATKTEVSVMTAIGLCKAIENTMGKLLVEDTIKTGRVYGLPKAPTPTTTTSTNTDLDSFL
jgi:hypothetical protein